MYSYQIFNLKNPIKPQDFEVFYNLLKSSFPDNEIRSKDGQFKLINNPLYNISVLRNNENEIIAALSTWHFESFVFGEHLAVDKKMRNSGIGTYLIKEFLKNIDKPWVIEVELPTNELAARRIKLYERNGLHFNEFEYFQPPMQPQYEPFPLRFMTYPKPMNSSELKSIKDILYKEVYKVK